MIWYMIYLVFKHLGLCLSLHKQHITPDSMAFSGTVYIKARVSEYSVKQIRDLAKHHKTWLLKGILFSITVTSQFLSNWYDKFSISVSFQNNNSFLFYFTVVPAFFIQCYLINTIFHIFNFFSFISHVGGPLLLLLLLLLILLDKFLVVLIVNKRSISIKPSVMSTKQD